MICPYRGYLTAVRASGITDKMLRSIKDEDNPREIPGLIPLYVDGRDQTLAATFTIAYRDGEPVRIIVRSRPDLIVAVPENPVPPIILELARTPISSARDIVHIVPRALVYAATYTACRGTRAIPVIVTTSTLSRYKALIVLGGERLLHRLLAEIHESLTSRKTPPDPRPGNHCVHCIYHNDCPSR